MAAIGLPIAVTGLCDLMADRVSRRTQELGVRLALGATRWQVVALGLLVATLSVIASCLPARRTATLDPMLALRAE